MNAELQEVKKEIAALYALLDKEERSKSEQYKVDNFDKELARLDEYRKTLVTALATAPAQTQGTLERLILDMDVDMPSFQPSNYSLEFPFFESKASH